MKPAKQQPIAASVAGIPADLVPMGFVAGAFGIRGWVKVVADTEFVDSLFEYPVWWLGRNGQWRAYKVLDSSAQPKNINAQLEGVDDRDAAAALKGMTVAVPRSEMPEADEGEYYWADLIGLEVVNLQAERLGAVHSLLGTGANDVLVVKDGDTERLIPFVGAVVVSVDQASGLIQVDWGLDY
ncbi:ribosome maturation factor RimM [Chitinimonas sp. BJB300]|uniref:ribosome maturation factor RimM n=1 Tax=Chitinimonas sp. BJB300 TaxID=1559339 RepID=UPI000C0F919E|nr:ribosome maturation factor RimM [Chitinimonas sp. BJB300]PHV10352.1 ribosome maturation factor RimM [Chitinimonas sp. BJB300]TSJ90819.1 ribosome maturation factor RimM [Chitinimonas sp. BJB300]